MGVIALLSVLLIETGCKGFPKDFHELSRLDVIDPTADLSRQDYRDLLNPDYPKDQKKQDLGAAIPEMTDIVAGNEPPRIRNDRLVSLSVTEDVPLKDVLLEIAKLADLDIEIDPKIQGGIILKVKDRPLGDVIEKISEIANLRFHIYEGVLTVERDLPFIKHYPVDFLNLTRSSNSTVSLTTGLVGGEGGGVGSGSKSDTTSSYDGDVWKTIQLDINSILDPSKADEGSGGATGGTVIVPKEEMTFITMNKQAGLVNVKATQKQHRKIADYLEQVRRRMSAQVLIEAKIVEVALNEFYESGIDWNIVEMAGLRMGLKGTFSGVAGQDAIFGNPTNNLAMGIFTHDSSISGANINDASTTETLVKLLNIFGTSRTLSSPRLNAMNNQQAILSFARNEVYFKLNIDQSPITTTTSTTNVTLTQTTVESELNTVPIGVLMTLQPSINVDTNEIIMNIRPTLSRSVGTVTDPAVSFAVSSLSTTTASTLTSTVPVVEVKELDSIVKIKSGDVMILGGMMEDRNVNEDQGVPFISAIPFIGNAFKAAQRTKRIVQTVIFIKATIVDSGDTPPEDQRFYNKFTRDPNRLIFR